MTISLNRPVRSLETSETRRPAFPLEQQSGSSLFLGWGPKI